MSSLAPGDVVWVDISDGVGREQGGRRPFVVVSTSEYLDLVDTLFVGAPITSVNRGWLNHVRVLGDTTLTRDSWIMTEQVRTLSRRRVFGELGSVSPECLRRVRLWIGEFVGVR